MKQHFTPGRALLLGLALLAAWPAGATEFMPLDEVRPGMKGFGLTVFRGTRVDTFAVEVVGVLPRSKIAGGSILVEASGHGLDLSRIAQGMSGSPIYLEGRLAGALAFGWPGSLEAIAGVTPVQEMLAMPEHALVPAVRDLGRLEAGLQDLRDLSAMQGDLAAALDGETTPSGSETTGSGTWPAADRLLLDLLQPRLQNAGVAVPRAESWFAHPVGAAGTPSVGGEEGTATSLVPGSACGVPLVMGDAVLGVTGTVTHVEGDRVLMMGHPFMQRGPVNLPLATAEVITVLPSREMSFKLGQIGRVIGTVHHDQRAGLVGTLGPVPRTIPVTVEITSGQHPRQSYRFEVVDDVLLTPALIFYTLYNSLLARGDDASDQNISYELEIRWSGDEALAAEPLLLRGVAGGPGGAMGLTAEWLTPFTLLLDNPFRSLQLEGVKARLELSRPAAQARITGLDADRHPTAEDGPLQVRIEVTPRRGAPEVRTIELDLPAGLPAGPYRLVAASEAEFFTLEAQRAAARFQVRRLESALEILRQPRSADRLMVALLGPGSNLMVADREFARLPGSVSRVLTGGNMQVQKTMADYLATTTLPVPFTLKGHAVRKIRIQSSSHPLAEEKRP